MALAQESCSLMNISSNTSTNLSKSPNTELVTEELAVNLLSANMIQIKMGMLEFSYVFFVKMCQN